MGKTIRAPFITVWAKPSIRELVLVKER